MVDEFPVEEQDWMVSFGLPLMELLRKKAGTGDRNSEPEDFIKSPDGDFECPFRGKYAARARVFNMHVTIICTNSVKAVNLYVARKAK